MTDQHIVARLPQLEVRGPKNAVITVTERDGDRVTTSTWNACLGVSAFVRAFLGEPAARAHIDIKEEL